jgi:glycosyltransferase involved in cell wall biosynthesis
MARLAPSPRSAAALNCRGGKISVIIPVLNEAPTIAAVVEFAACSSLVSEVIVLDDGSIDGTPELARAAGARVVTSTMLGKGGSMEDGVQLAANELLLYLDGDLTGVMTSGKAGGL